MSKVHRPPQLKGSPSDAESLPIVRQELAESLREAHSGMSRGEARRRAEAAVARTAESMNEADRRPREW